MGMTVQELIERLQECDPDAVVRIMSQEAWPFENAISGVAVREDFDVNHCDCDHRFTEPHEEGCAALEDNATPDLEPNDVFIVEGAQERYGNKDAWPAARS